MKRSVKTRTQSTATVQPAKEAASDAHTLLQFRDWNSLHYGLIWAYEGAVIPASRNASATHNEYSCWLIRKGSVRLRTAGKTTTASAGQWVFVARPTRHQSFSEDAELLSIHFHCAWPGGEPLIEQEQSCVFDAARFPMLEKAALPIVRSIRRHLSDSGYFLPQELCSLQLYFNIQSLLPRWLGAYTQVQAELNNLPRRSGLIDPRVRDALAALDRHPLNVKFSEQNWVHDSSLGRSQLNALFTAATGTTPRRYYERRRLQAAEQLLGHTGTSLKEIALGLGFRTASHFSHWWRKHKGQAPSAQRP